MLMALVVSVKRESAHADLEPTSIEKLTGNNYWDSEPTE